MARTRAAAGDREGAGRQAGGAAERRRRLPFAADGTRRRQLPILPVGRTAPRPGHPGDLQRHRRAGHHGGGPARAARTPAHRAGALDGIGTEAGRSWRRHVHRGRPGNGALRARGDGTSGNGGDQGEVVVLPERFAVSPSHGRFYPAALSRFTDEGPYVERGDLLGEVRNGAASIPVLSAFRGQVMAHLAWEGELVTPGQILLSLRPF